MTVLSSQGKTRLKRQEKKKEKERINKIKIDIVLSNVSVAPLSLLNKKGFPSKVLTF